MNLFQAAISNEQLLIFIIIGSILIIVLPAYSFMKTMKVSFIWAVLTFPVYALGWLFGQIKVFKLWVSSWKKIPDEDWQSVIDAEQKRSRKAAIQKSNALKAHTGNYK